MVHACNLSCLGAWSRRITWTQDAEVAVSQDRATTFQAGWQNETLSQQNKTKNNRHIYQWNRTDKPEIKEHIYNQMIIDKADQNFCWDKEWATMSGPWYVYYTSIILFLLL